MRKWNLFGSLLVIAAIFIAIFVEVYDSLAPCPLCILQRIAIVFCLFFLISLVLSRHSPRQMFSFGVLISLSAVSGIVLAGRQLWLQSHAATGSMCIPDMGRLQDIDLLHWLSRSFQGSANCAIVDWQFWGLSMAAWALLAFLAVLLLGFANIVAGVRGKN